MACHGRILVASNLLLMVVLLPAATSVAQEPPQATVGEAVPRVRSSSPRLGALLDQAAAASATFRALVTAIEATDGIVYLQESKCPRGVVACLEHRVTLAGAYRVLFIRISTDRPDLEVMASAGHELQHALEVLGNRSLRSNAAVQLFYYVPGAKPSTPRARETPEAAAAELAVHRELRRARGRELK